MKKIYLLLPLLLVATASSAELKVGFLDATQVLEKAPQTIKAKERLEKEFLPREKRLLAMQKEIQDLEEKLTKDAAVMSESERRKLEKDVVSKNRELKRSNEEFQEDLGERRKEEVDNLQRRIREAIRAFAKDEGFDLLLTEGVIYASEKVDVTDKVQKKLAKLTSK